MSVCLSKGIKRSFWAEAKNYFIIFVHRMILISIIMKSFMPSIKLFSNKRYLQLASLVAVSSASVLSVSCSMNHSNESSSAIDKPNFIVIYCDDMGYGDLSCFGNPTIRTPYLDQMAMEGQKWTSFYVSASVSSPSRSGLLTGRLGVRTGMYGNRKRVLSPGSPKGLPQDEITLPELLREGGYSTGIVGKWHVGHHEESMPLANGFDYFYGSPFSNDMSKKEQTKVGNSKYPYEYIIYDQDKIVEKEPDQTQLTKRFTEKAVSYIKAHKDKPFFLYLAHPMPHWPVYASETFQGRSARGVYGDCIEEVDWSVGQIIKTLKENGLDKNTLVVFTSDNGPWLPYKQQAGTAGPLRDGKASHCEGGFRVPCIIWGDMVKRGQVTNMGSTLDLLPTFCEMAKVDLPTNRVYDGKSLLKVFKDPSANVRDVFYFYRGSDLYAIRKGEYKLHFIDKPAYGSTPKVILEEPVLYDLGTDPEEKYNVADKYPEVVVELKAMAKKHISSFTIAESIFDQK